MVALILVVMARAHGVVSATVDCYPSDIHQLLATMACLVLLKKSCIEKEIPPRAQDGLLDPAIYQSRIRATHRTSPSRLCRPRNVGIQALVKTRFPRQRLRETFRSSRNFLFGDRSILPRDQARMTSSMPWSRLHAWRL